MSRKQRKHMVAAGVLVKVMINRRALGKVGQSARKYLSLSPNLSMQFCPLTRVHGSLRLWAN